MKGEVEHGYVERSNRRCPVWGCGRDALGGPLEFMSAEEIARRYGRVKTMLGGGWLGLRPGETTDDTAMTLAVAEGIMERPEAPFQAIGARFIKWAKSGPKDIGGTCGSSICRAMTAGGECPPFQVWSEASQQTAKLNGNRSGGNRSPHAGYLPWPLLSPPR